MYAAIAKEVRATLALAAPLAAANLAQMAMGVTDTIMVGTLGGVALAAVGLGGGFYFLGAIVCQGVLNAVAPLSAFAIGAGDRRAAGRIAGAGMTLAALLVVPVVCLLLAVAPALRRLGYDPALADEIGRFLRAIAWGTPAFLGFAVLRSLLASMGRARAVMIVLALCVPTLAGLNWILIFGHLGAPRLGVVGCGYASAINQWLMLLGLGTALWAVPRHDLARRLSANGRQVLGDLRRILALGLPIAGLQALEMGVFMASAALMGLFGTEPLAAHQIAINVASTTFMVPLGIGQAATVRIAAERGAGKPAVARGAGYVALAMGAVFMAAAAVAMWTLTRPIIGAYVALADPPMPR
jgi:MATE family, multidrug efflux pump